MGMIHKTGPNQAHRIWFTSLVDWDRLIRNWLCTQELKTNIVQDMWENEFAILKHIVRIQTHSNVFDLSLPGDFHHLAFLPVNLQISWCRNTLVLVPGFSFLHYQVVFNDEQT